MTWIKALTRELPYHTFENWSYACLKGCPKLLGVGLKNIVFNSQRNVVEIYWVKEEFGDLMAKLADLCLNKPKLIMSYYDELEELDKKIVFWSKQKIKTKVELKEYIQDIEDIMNHYATIYLIKVFSNYAITEEIAKKQPELAKQAKNLLSKAKWFQLSQTIYQNTSSVLKAPKKTVSMFNLKEILKSIDADEIDYKLAEKRYNGFAWNLLTNRFYYEKQAKDYIQSLGIVEEKITETDTIKGSVASKGKIQGKAVIVLCTEDFPKIKQDDVIVAPMTTPWYTPHLSKAKAIITDEGGTGCHASIIARELQIPCIIGTKIATKVLKNGDLIEVDANKGIIKILKKHQ